MRGQDKGELDNEFYSIMNNIIKNIEMFQGNSNGDSGGRQQSACIQSNKRSKASRKVCPRNSSLTDNNKEVKI